MNPRTPSGNVHWLGAGLSAEPGLRRLREAPAVAELTLWNRTPARGRALADRIGLPAGRVREWDPDRFVRSLSAGDVVVSFLTAEHHPAIAAACLEKSAHLFTSSYLSPAMRAFAAAAAARGLYFCNELGLDPGLDHFFAHRLVERMKREVPDLAGTEIEFFSGCGGFPAVPGDFRYQFSWSPLGVLRALRNPAQWLERGETKTSATPGEEAAARPVGSEVFEAYPNRDSLPFLEEYGLAGTRARISFQRATLRPPGWREAWREVFRELRTRSPESLATYADELCEAHRYAPGERDRIVLAVSLRVRRGDRTLFTGEISLDATGSERGSAMARSVSGTTSVFVELFLEGKLQRRLPAGVHGFDRALLPLADEIRAGLDRFGLEIAAAGDVADDPRGMGESERFSALAVERFETMTQNARD